MPNRYFVILSGQCLLHDSTTNNLDSQFTKSAEEIAGSKRFFLLYWKNYYLNVKTCKEI